MGACCSKDGTIEDQFDDVNALLGSSIPKSKIVTNHLTFHKNKYEDEEEDYEVPICVVCMDEIANTAFVHGTSAHMKCCSLCAKQVMKKSKKCPYCGTTTEKTVTVY